MLRKLRVRNSATVEATPMLLHKYADILSDSITSIAPAAKSLPKELVDVKESNWYKVKMLLRKYALTDIVTKEHVLWILAALAKVQSKAEIVPTGVHKTLAERIALNSAKAIHTVVIDKYLHEKYSANTQLEWGILKWIKKLADHEAVYTGTAATLLKSNAANAAIISKINSDLPAKALLLLIDGSEMSTATAQLQVANWLYAYAHDKASLEDLQLTVYVPHTPIAVNSEAILNTLLSTVTEIITSTVKSSPVIRKFSCSSAHGDMTAININ